MRAAEWAFALAAMLLAGCGPSAETPPIAAKPDVTVTLDDKHHGCVVALYSEASGSAISCDDVVRFMREELRLASGSIYDIRAASEADEAGMAKVEANLKEAGYRFIGRPHARSTGAPDEHH
jgi:hypothetical protein